VESVYIGVDGQWNQERGRVRQSVWELPDGCQTDVRCIGYKVGVHQSWQRNALDCTTQGRHGLTPHFHCETELVRQATCSHTHSLLHPTASTRGTPHPLPEPARHHPHSRVQSGGASARRTACSCSLQHSYWGGAPPPGLSTSTCTVPTPCTYPGQHQAFLLQPKAAKAAHRTSSESSRTLQVCPCFSPTPTTLHRLPLVQATARACPFQAGHRSMSQPL
jgi:hypothetical protein